ncbi:MAG: ATP-binding protein, partial [Thermofilum sp. ex4484_79]
MVSDLYLGKKVDLNTLTETGENFYLDPDDLMTHGAIIGMTGSGKTGAAIVLIEEMILKKIPVIVIDPKGDAVNIALRFPNLSPEEFKKWIDPLKAQRENVSVNEYARRLSEKWKENILRYTGSLDVLKRLTENGEVLIFTPGYLGGLPISVLHDLNIPEDISWSGNEDILLERIKNTVSAILELIGRNPDPLKSNEHILLSQIIEYCWKE